MKECFNSTDYVDSIDRVDSGVFEFNSNDICAFTDDTQTSQEG